MAAPDHGKYYWFIETYTEKLWLHADSVEITKNGDLLFKKGESINYGFSAGRWRVFYAASIIDGGSVCLEHFESKEEESDS